MIDDAQSTSTYMSMTGRKSPSNLKRTTFTKDIKEALDTKPTNNMDNTVKRYTVTLGMRSPQRTRHAVPADVTGRGSPKPNPKARVDTGLGSMGSPQRQRPAADNRSSYKVSST